MFGHFVSETRKLNRHYQSEINLGLFNAIQTDNLLVYKGFKSLSQLSYSAIQGTIGGQNMYIIKGSMTLDKEIKKDNNVIGNYNSVPYNLIANDGVAMDKLYDGQQQLTGTDKKFFGYQITTFYLNKDGRKDTSNYFIPGNYTQGVLFPNNLEQLKAENPMFQAIDAIDSGVYVPQYYFKLPKEQKHDTSQVGNKEYIGKMGEGTLLTLGSKVESSSVENTDDWSNASVTLTVGIPDNQYTGNNAISFQLPPIGISYFQTVASNVYGENFYLVYVITPTIYDDQGKVADLKH